MNSPWARLRGKIVDARPDELRALALAFAFNFVILGSYYVIRPIRDEIGAAGGLESLSWMFTGTLGAMLIANALFSAIVARMSRRRFIPIAYRFFIVNLGLFYLLMRTAPAAQQVWIGRAFYIWVSVFNLFVVTVFWAFMTDIFNSEQGKRLFGFISIGGSLGGIMGPYITASLVAKSALPIYCSSPPLCSRSARNACAFFLRDSEANGARAEDRSAEELIEADITAH